MRTTYAPSVSGRSLDLSTSLPTNLKDWLSSSALVHEVWNAIDSAGWPPVSRNAMGTCPEAVLRTVVVYCLATGIYGSKEIEAAAAHDPVVRYLCARNLPRWEQIREFRRRHAPFLKESLITLFTIAFERQAATEEKNYRYLLSGRFHGQVAPNFVQAADERLRRAIQADSMAMDD